MSKKYLIVGGVAGGASAAARLRRLDENAQVIMFEKGPYVSFSNCCLPYHVSKIVPKLEKLVLMSPEKFAKQYNIEARVNSEVISINREERFVIVKNVETGETYKENYDKLVLSPGAKAVFPNFEGKDKMDIFTLRDVPDIAKIMAFIDKKKPKHMTVIGGGFVGVEMAENLREIGIEVTLVEAMEQIMMTFDNEMVQVLHKCLVDHGVKLELKQRVSKFAKGKVILENGNKIKTDGVILSIGVTPRTEFIKQLGINLDDRGYILVDDNYQTNDSNIYAVGDAIKVKYALSGKVEPLPLAGPANKQGRLVADHINGLEIDNRGYIGSSVIKVFNYTAAVTGLTERYIKQHELNIDYEVVYSGPGDRVGLMPGAKPILMKALFEKGTGKILGAQALGEGFVEKRIDVIATAIKFGGTVKDLQDLELCYAPPYATGKDAVNFIGYIGNNLNKGDYKQVSFTKVRELLCNDAQIIDVREEAEYENGHIIGAKNVPMSQMRQRFSEIDKSKPVYVHCRTAQRSYNMTLYLQSLGYDVYNIAGSYLFISIFEDTMDKLENRKSILTKPNFK